MPRSAANRNCMRSLDPMDTKSASRISAGSCHSNAGTSIMLPISTWLGDGRTRAASANRIPFAARNSATVATIGNITESGRSPAASNRARSCRRSIAGRSRPTRSERQPMAGFSSVCTGASGNSLSPPRSSVRNRTGRSPAASSTRAYRAAWSGTSSTAPRASIAISVRNRPIPAAPVVSRCSTSRARPTFSIRRSLTPSRVRAGRCRWVANPASIACRTSRARV